MWLRELGRVSLRSLRLRAAYHGGRCGSFGRAGSHRGDPRSGLTVPLGSTWCLPRRSRASETGRDEEEDDEKPSSSSDQDAPQTEPLPLSRLFGLARKEAPLIGFALSAQLVSAASSMVLPFALGKIVDALSSDSLTQMQDLQMYTLGLLAVSTIASLGVIVRSSAMTVVGERISRDLRNSVFRGLMRQETAFFDERQSGELASRLSVDTLVVSRTLSDNLARIVRSSTTTISSIACLVWISPKLATVTFLLGPPVVYCSLYFGRIVRGLSRDNLDALAKATDVASERIAAIHMVRTFGAENQEAARYKARLDDTYSIARRMAISEGLYAGSAFYLAQMALIGVLWLGGNMVISGSMSVGSLTSFAMYAVNLGYSVSNLSNAYGGLTKGQGAGTRIFEILDRAPLSRPVEGARKRPESFDTTISFQDVTFAYPTRKQSPVLRGLSFDVRAGEVLGVAGSSGSGKSTIVYLLSRLYDPISGEIRIGGIDVADLDSQWLHRHVGVVSQNPVMFSGSIAENIAYGLDESEFTWNDVAEVGRVTGIDQMIARFPDGYETQVGERGVKLSGGEKQRIALARAFIRKPSILILDEATSALDPRNETSIGDVIDVFTHRKGLPVLLISHRVSSLQRADRIVVLQGGRIAQAGRFDDLASVPGPFAEILSTTKQHHFHRPSLLQPQGQVVNTHEPSP